MDAADAAIAAAAVKRRTQEGEEAPVYYLDKIDPAAEEGEGEEGSSAAGYRRLLSAAKGSRGGRRGSGGGGGGGGGQVGGKAAQQSSPSSVRGGIGSSGSRRPSLSRCSSGAASASSSAAAWLPAIEDGSVRGGGGGSARGGSSYRRSSSTNQRGDEGWSPLSTNNSGMRELTEASDRRWRSSSHQNSSRRRHSVDAVLAPTTDGGRFVCPPPVRKGSGGGVRLSRAILEGGGDLAFGDSLHLIRAAPEAVAAAGSRSQDPDADNAIVAAGGDVAASSSGRVSAAGARPPQLRVQSMGGGSIRRMPRPARRASAGVSTSACRPDSAAVTAAAGVASAHPGNGPQQLLLRAQTRSGPVRELVRRKSTSAAMSSTRGVVVATAEGGIVALGGGGGAGGSVRGVRRAASSFVSEAAMGGGVAGTAGSVEPGLLHIRKQPTLTRSASVILRQLSHRDSSTRSTASTANGGGDRGGGASLRRFSTFSPSAADDDSLPTSAAGPPALLRLSSFADRGGGFAPVIVARARPAVLGGTTAEEAPGAEAARTARIDAVYSRDAETARNQRRILVAAFALIWTVWAVLAWLAIAYASLVCQLLGAEAVALFVQDWLIALLIKDATDSLVFLASVSVAIYQERLLRNVARRVGLDDWLGSLADTLSVRAVTSARQLVKGSTFETFRVYSEHFRRVS